MVCCPRISSNTKLMPIPNAMPMLYDNVIILPVASFNEPGSLCVDNIIDNDALSPFVMPNATVKMNDGVSPRMTGCDRGVQQSRMRANMNVRIVASKIN